MSCFDRVNFVCPTPSCDGVVEFQSKAGECLMLDFSGDEGPPAALAADIAGETTYCGVCKESFKVIPAIPFDKIPMRLVSPEMPWQQDDEDDEDWGL